MSDIPELDNDGPEPVNVLEYLQYHGISEQDAYNILLHLLFTRTYGMADEVRQAATELGFVVPLLTPSNGTLH